MSNRRFPLQLDEGSRAHIALRLARAVLVVGVVCGLPYVLEPFRLGQVAAACVYAVVLVGLNLLSGFGGQVSLGHAAFFGLGAYITGVLTLTYGVPAPLAFLASVIGCFVVGALVAFPALRLRGVYIALVTLAVGLIFPSLVIRLDSLTGGSAGLFGVTWDPPDSAYFAGINGSTLWHFWLAVGGLGIAALVVRNLVRSRFGRSLLALRDNEAAAVVMGVNRAYTRTLVFGASAGIAGLGGAVFAVSSGILTPTGFSLLLTLYFLAGLVMGGPGSLWGPVFGGFLVYYIPVWASELTSSSSGASLAGVLLGVILIAVTFGLRGGLAGFLRASARRLVVLVPAVPRPDRSTAGPGTPAGRRDLQATDDRAAEASATPDDVRVPSTVGPDDAPRP